MDNSNSDLLWHADAARYRSAEFQQIEREKIFDRAWLVAGAAGHVQRPGQYLTATLMGRGVVVVRGDDGRLRAFHNQCLHRGTRLLDGKGKTDCIACPYHGWKYALDGRVTDIPGRDGIVLPGEMNALRLHEVPCVEAIGLVWLSFRANPPDLLKSLHGIPEELAAYRLEEMRPIQERTWEMRCNWKAVLENATEAYHLASVHPWSVGSNVNESPDFHPYGDHARLTLAIAPYEWRRRIDRLTSRGGPYTARQWDALQKYLLFPNTLINVIPCHLTVFQVWPTGPNRCTFFYGFYGRKGAGPLEWLRARASWLFSRWVLHEDMRILMEFQRGVDNEHVQRQWFHRSEVAAAHMQGAITRWIGAEE